MFIGTYIRRSMSGGIVAILLATCAMAVTMRFADLKPIVIHATYDHDKFGTLPRDTFRQMGAYVVSFDGNDDNNGDGTADKWAIPEWVAYEIKRFDGELGAGPDRPSSWITDDSLFAQTIMPHDDSYKFSNAWRAANPDSPMAGFDRGHMCMKQIAWRIGADEDWNTHFLMNACPQKSDLNQGIWLDLENKTQEWADEFGSVWVICGPIVYNQVPQHWLGEAGEVPVAIPDAFYKIVVKQALNGGLDVLAFIYPQTGIDYRVSAPKKHDHTPYLCSVDEIEALTGLDFLSTTDDAVEDAVERIVQVMLWD